MKTKSCARWVKKRREAGVFRRCYILGRKQGRMWADKYKNVDNIPAEEWLSHGWYFVCNTCGENIEDVADFHVNDKGYCCKKCFDDWGKRKVEETMVIMEKYYSEYDSPIISYVCGECGEKFLDRDDNYRFCPYCGRKIVYGKEQKNENIKVFAD